MSTRSNIGMVLENGTFRNIYCHNDGYPSGVGKTLVKHYTDPEKVKALLDLGNISSLGDSIECPAGHSFENPVKGFTVAYDRDRGENGQEALVSTRPKCEEEYLYIFNKGKWACEDDRGKVISLD